MISWDNTEVEVRSFLLETRQYFKRIVYISVQNVPSRSQICIGMTYQLVLWNAYLTDMHKRLQMQDKTTCIRYLVMSLVIGKKGEIEVYCLCLYNWKIRILSPPNSDYVSDWSWKPCSNVTKLQLVSICNWLLSSVIYFILYSLFWQERRALAQTQITEAWKYRAKKPKATPITPWIQSKKRKQHQ